MKATKVLFHNRSMNWHFLPNCVITLFGITVYTYTNRKVKSPRVQTYSTTTVVIQINHEQTGFGFGFFP